MKRENVLTVAIATVVGLSAFAFQECAGATISVNNSEPFQTAALDRFVVTGGQMEGMEVTVNFANAGPKTASWIAADSNSGGAANTGWFTMTQAGTTFTQPWSLENVTADDEIISFSINAAPGGVVFDRTNPSKGTPGSDLGWDFELLTSGDADVLYEQPVAVVGKNPEGDLFLKMSVVLTEPVGGGKIARFRKDTDNARAIEPVPEMTHAMGLAMILAGALFIRQRRNS